MKGPSRLFRSLIAFACALPGAVAAAELTSRPNAADGPTEVMVRVLIIDLETISGADQNFTANVAYAARWTDERLRHDGEGDKMMSLGEIWHPRLQIVNRQRLQETFADEARVSPDGSVEVVQRVWGQFSQPLVLHDFPFDQQELRVDIVAAGHQEGSVLLQDDPELPSGVSEALSVPDWALENWSVTVTELSIAQGDQVHPTMRLALSLKRKYAYHLVNMVIPLLMIICMSWVVFWINPKISNPRISVSVTAMLTLVAYRFAVGNSLPKISYLTRLDWFILGSSVLVLISLLEVVITFSLAESGREETADRINRWMRFAAPVAFALIAFTSLSG